MFDLSHGYICRRISRTNAGGRRERNIIVHWTLPRKTTLHPASPVSRFIRTHEKYLSLACCHTLNKKKSISLSLQLDDPTGKWPLAVTWSTMYVTRCRMFASAVETLSGFKLVESNADRNIRGRLDSVVLYFDVGGKHLQVLEKCALR